MTFALGQLPVWCGGNTRFHMSALESICQAVKDRLLGEDFFNVLVFPNPSHVQQGTGQDLRPIGDDYLEFMVIAGYINEIDYGQSINGFKVEGKPLEKSIMRFTLRPPVKVSSTEYWVVSSWPTDITPMDDEHVLWIKENSPLQIDEFIRCPDLLAFLDRASVQLGRRVHALIEMNEGRRAAYNRYRLPALGPVVKWEASGSVYRLKFVSMPLESSDQSMIVNVIGGKLEGAERGMEYGKAMMEAYNRMYYPVEGVEDTLGRDRREITRSLLIKAYDDFMESHPGEAITPKEFSEVLADEQYAIVHQWFKDLTQVLEEARKLGPTRNEIKEYKVWMYGDIASSNLSRAFLQSVHESFVAETNN